MKKISFIRRIVPAVTAMFTLAACGNYEEYSESTSASAQGTSLVTSISATVTTSSEGKQLSLSDMVVEITSDDKTATFQLYDTKAAAEFYNQLPLTLDLSNFRNAQWMFYPPEKLSVTDEESYHDGKKGELSYYEPWGDVFMLYKDFYAGDEMHRLGVCLTGIDEIEGMTDTITVAKQEPAIETLQIQVEANGNTIVYELNDSTAAKSLYDQLPLTIESQDYSNDEKIFYPPAKLNTTDTPLADAKNGTLAYFAPWGDVVMFYDDFGSYSGLYELGQIVLGKEYIPSVSGDITISKVEKNDKG